MSALRSNSAQDSKAEEVERLYQAELTVLEIAQALRISPQGVYWHLEKLGLPSPTKRAAS